jgi:PAS domain S-box-containing protein
MPYPDFKLLTPTYINESSTILFAIMDEQGVIHFVNTLFKKHFSPSRIDFQNLLFHSVLHPKDVERFQNLLSEFQSISISTAEEVFSQPESIGRQEVQWEFSSFVASENQKKYISCLGNIVHKLINPSHSPLIEEEYRRLSLVAQNTSSAVIITDKYRHITWVNEGFCRLSGYTIEEVLGKNPSFLQYEGSNPETIKMVREKLELAEPFFFEILNKGKQGNIYWLEIEILPIKDELGNLKGFMAIQNDITQRKKAEELLLMSETQLIANLNNTPNVAVQWYDERGRVTYWNPASERLYGWKSEDTIGKTLDQLIQTPEEAQAFLNILEEIKNTGEPFGPYESPVFQKDGSQRWVLATTFSIPLGNDRIGFVCMDVDITEQKTISNALIESEEKYKSVISAIGEGLVVQDLEDKIIMCNQSAADILGLTLEQLTGKDSFDPQWMALKEDGSPFAPEEHPTMITLKTGKSIDGILMNVQTGKGERKYIIINSRPVLNHEGKMYAAVASFKDITAQKVAEQELLKTNKELVSFQEQLKHNIEELYASQAKIEEQKQHLEQEINERKQAQAKILAQNQILREIAWHQSHSLRRPVATILGLVDLINKEKNASSFEKEQYLLFLLRTTRELDAVIHTIVEKTNEIE